MHIPFRFVQFSVVRLVVLPFERVLRQLATSAAVLGTTQNVKLAEIRRSISSPSGGSAAAATPRPRLRLRLRSRPRHS